MMGCSSSQSGSVPPGENVAGASDPEKLAADIDSNLAATEASSGDKYPPAEAFEISLDNVDNSTDDNDKNDSLIKKHPPKRLQKLVEQAATAVPATTIEHLEDKLAKAEVRRQQYIQQRIENIITLTSKGGNVGGGSGDGDTEGIADDQNDNLKDGEVAVMASSRTSSSSSQDADVVMQPSSLSDEAAVAVDKQHADGGHHDGPDKSTHP